MNSFLALLAPLGALVVLGAMLTFVVGRLEPSLAVRVSLGAMLAAAAATAAVLLHYGMVTLLELPFVGDRLHALVHPDAPHSGDRLAIALAATAWTLVAMWRLQRLFGAYRAERSRATGGIIETDCEVPVAYSLPGPRPTVVVSRGMSALLDRDEFRVVLAHERAHAELRHDLALLAGRVCVVAMPLLAPMMRVLEHAIEREADEVAARECGNRRLVARAVAKVALESRELLFSPGISVVGPAARAQHMLDGGRTSPRLVSFVASGGTFVLVGLGMLQWHHVVRAVASVCGV